MKCVRLLVVGLIGWGSLTIPNSAKAQSDRAEVVRANNWNVFVFAGPSTYGRFLLQRPNNANTTSNEAALRGEDAVNLGGGMGVNVMERVGIRVSYAFGSMDLAFRDDTGNGSERLDATDLGTLRHHVASAEVVRYVLSPRRAIVPYGSAGFVGTWWVLADDVARIDATGGGTQFRFGAIGSLGVMLHATDRIDLRVEAASMSVRNPFAGGESYRALGGSTIDEPTRVGRTDFRVAAVYNFGRARETSTSANR
jgi:hypothetical protein